MPFLLLPSHIVKKPFYREREHSVEPENRRLEKRRHAHQRKPLHPSGRRGFRPWSHTVFLHGTAGGAGGGINVAADGFHVLAYSADRMAGNTPKKGGDTQNNQFAFHRFIGRVPSGQTPFLRTPFKEPFMMPHRRSCHSPFLPCAPATLKKHASTGENIRRAFRPRSRNHYYLLPR